MSNFNVIQLGANVGKSQTDATWILVEKYGWSGLFVEPLPESFKSFQITIQPIQGIDLNAAQ